MSHLKISCGDLGVVGIHLTRVWEQGPSSTPSQEPLEDALASLNSLTLARLALESLRVQIGTLTFLWVKD